MYKNFIFPHKKFQGHFHEYGGLDSLTTDFNVFVNKNLFNVNEVYDK